MLIIIGATAIGAVVAILGLKYFGFKSHTLGGPAAAASAIAAMLVMNRKKQSASPPERRQ